MSIYNYYSSYMLYDIMCVKLKLLNVIILEINKNLKFKKGVGIAIKSKETSSKLAI